MTTDSLTGLCAISPSSENCYLAYPLPQKAAIPSSAQPPHSPPGSAHVSPTSGEVLLFDMVKLEAINVVEAHRSPLSWIGLNSDGKMLATASDKGTIIRVFSVPNGHKLYQFRRGSMPSHIFSMSFNVTSTLLCVSSATDTIHIFKLGPQNAPTPEKKHVTHTPPSISRRRRSHGSESPSEASDEASDENITSSVAPRKHDGTLIGAIRRTSQNVGSSLVTTMGGYLPKGVAEMWEPARDFACIKLPKPAGSSDSSPLRSVVAMIGHTSQVMVVTNKGNFYLFSIDLVKGGEGSLIKESS